MKTTPATKLIATIVVVIGLAILCIYWSSPRSRETDSAASRPQPESTVAGNSSRNRKASPPHQIDEPTPATGAAPQVMEQTPPLTAQASPAALQIQTINEMEEELAAKSRETAEYSISMAEYLQNGYVLDPDPESTSALVSLRDGAEVEDPKGYAMKYIELKANYLSSKAMREAMESRLKRERDGALPQRSK
jgi:type IV secretory pathway VirB10-like protein